MSESLVVNEIYLSVQGESTWAGLPCIFIRLTACNLRCSYCDTAYAFTEGGRKSVDDICAQVDELAAPFAKTGNVGSQRLPLIELTGGEPLLQKSSIGLMSRFCDSGYTVLLETSGAHDVSGVDGRVRKIMDLKSPSSGESERIRWENLNHLSPMDEIKFVLGSVEDYEWMKEIIQERQLSQRCPLLVSWVHPLAPEQQDPSLHRFPEDHTPIARKDLVERIIADALPVRFQIQMHKVVWAPEERAV
jgi:7-carboxy-7-deazaguanine synthase